MSKLDLNEFLYAGNQVYVVQLYERYLDDPGSVDLEWQDFFFNLKDKKSNLNIEILGASWAPSESGVLGKGMLTPLSEEMADSSDLNSATAAYHDVPRMSVKKIRQATLDSIQALMLIRAYRVRGHVLANIDPLGIEGSKEHLELDPMTYGFSENDMDREIFINYVLGLEAATMREILDILRETYCGSIGVEFMHIQDPHEKSWIQERIERIRNQANYTVQGKKAILNRLIETEGFERYLGRKFSGVKRFGLDGGESLVPAMEQIFKRGSQLGIEEIVIGMSHRGRLNVLANVLSKPFQAIFHEFLGGEARPDDAMGSGDVKYHLGASADRSFDGKSVHLTLTANPSHLELVNTVCLGKVRSKQVQKNDTECEKIMALLLHGDAAMSGQGLVPETFDLSNLVGYQTGGTIHIIVNNQIGFTTDPRHSRSSLYCSDVAKIVSAPIFHVNADDVEAVVHCARIATEYRQKFKRDVVIDMICYRRHGHNEGDEPMFTQPLMYNKIANHPTTRQIYGTQLEKEGVIVGGEVDTESKRFDNQLDDAFEAAATFKANKADWLDGAWTGLSRSIATSDPRRGATGVSLDRLNEIGQVLSKVPDNFNVHSKIIRQLKNKHRMFENGGKIDWATAEALAFGSLLMEGHAVRLSGQDSERGTFSQRHSVLIDQVTEERYIPLNSLRFGQAPFEVINSPLSEAGVLGFEYGYSLAGPQMLILWEAQFGDFANGAQAIIDQFICSGEHKWLRMCGLVMLLPHGYEGQGPEHSSARLERYLQLCAEDNIQVCNCTTPANYYHALRRQLTRDFRKPLIIMAPKSLLRHKLCVSDLSEMGETSTFHRILWDDEDPTDDENRSLVKDHEIKRVILCSGKVYYDLIEERKKRRINNIYVMRVEQIYPFPFEPLNEDLGRFVNADFVWCQEEPRNMGAWTYTIEPMQKVLEGIGRGNERVLYAGRVESASPATGLMSKHIKEHNNLIENALNIQNKMAKARKRSSKASVNKN